MPAMASPSFSPRTSPTKLAIAPISLRPRASASSSRPTSKSVSCTRTRGTLASRHRRKERDLVAGTQRRRRVAPVDLDLRNRLGLVALDEHEVAGREPLQLVLQRRLRGTTQLVHERPALRGAHEHFGAARMAMAIRVLAGLVDVELVMRVLDERHAKPFANRQRDDLLDERGLPAAAVSRDPDDLHAPDFRMFGCRPRSANRQLTARNRDELVEARNLALRLSRAADLAGAAREVVA